MQKGLEDKDDDNVLKQHVTFTVQFLNAKQGAEHFTSVTSILISTLELSLYTNKCFQFSEPWLPRL